MIERKNITGIILAGGKSSRMGTDKAMLKLNDKSFMQHVIEALKPLVNDIIIVSDNPEHDKLHLVRVTDIIKNEGPLVGLYSGVSHSNTTYNLVVSCDVPFITTEVLNQLITNHEKEFDVVQLESQNKSMPLTALYNNQCTTQIKDLLDSGERRVRAAVSQLKVKTIKLNDHSSNAVTNINTKEQFKQITNAIAD